MGSIEAILDGTRVLAGQPLPTGPRIAVIGNSGGPGILGADAAVAGGLTVPVLSGRATAAMNAASPEAASWANPIDLGAGAQPHAVRDAIRVVLDSHEVDAVLAVFAETLVAEADELLGAITDESVGATIPVVVTMLAGHAGATGQTDPTPSFSVFAFPESAARALAVAHRYAVALKIARGDVVHKTERGGVALDLGDASAVATAFARVVASCGDGDSTVVVQSMIPAGTEVIIGAVQDEQFGPIVMFGAGGVLSDLLADRAFRLLPLTDIDAAAMIDQLRMAPLFDGFRGRPPVSREVLRDRLHRVAALVDDHPQIAELDLNPVVCTGPNLIAVDAKIRLRPAATRPDPLVRQLRATAR